jgi:hypothetical protein
MLTSMSASPSRRSSPSSRRRQQPFEGGLLGLGLDGQDGHKRITRGDDFLLLGGSEQTHERLQDMVIRMNEKLKRSGRRFTDLSSTEFEDLARDSL